jgi:putative nucleotidyltransferase with HDIG domain
MMAKKVDNIVDAVKMVGLRGIKNLLYSYGTFQILGSGETGSEKKKLWDHSYRTAYYAYNLAKNFKPTIKGLQDDSYVGGMLHDMGKIVFSAVHPALLDKIRAFCKEKGIPGDTFEDIAGGMNHAEIGARIAEKWNFPDSLVAAIRFHHEPALMTTDFKDVVNTVYLGNVFCEYENGNLGYEQVESSVLADFGITNEKNFKAIVDRMSEGFRLETSRMARDAAAKR